MEIEYYTGFDDEFNEVFKIISVDIEEDRSIGELVLKLHDLIGIPVTRELKWADQTETIACRYYYKSPESSFVMIEDLKKKISDIPKHGLNGELSLFINNSSGLAN